MRAPQVEPRLAPPMASKFTAPGPIVEVYYFFASSPEEFYGPAKPPLANEILADKNWVTVDGLGEDL